MAAADGAAREDRRIRTHRARPRVHTGHITAWSEEQFVARFKSGAGFKGSKMPWVSFAQMNDDDIKSIYRYLRTLPPAKNVTGPTRRPVGSYAAPAQ